MKEWTNIELLQVAFLIFFQQRDQGDIMEHFQAPPAGFAASWASLREEDGGGVLEGQTLGSSLTTFPKAPSALDFRL